MRARQWVAIAAFAAVVPVWAALLWGARGPSYLWFNMDPSYAYLLNSLRVAEGHSPTHTDHPGTPVQVQYCPKCNEPVMPHRVCPNCGSYQGRDVINMEENEQGK